MWDGAEGVCVSSLGCGRLPPTFDNLADGIHVDGNDNDEEEHRPDGIRSVYTLIDLAISNPQLVRHANRFATTFYNIGGRLRFVKARLKHAYHTITKLVVKGQVPLVERQVERVDWAVKRVRDDSRSGDGDNGGIGIVAAVVKKEKTASNEVRQYALERLSDAVVNGKVTDGSVERCARIWGVVDYHRFGTEEEKEAARLKRKLKFIQLEDVLPVGGGVGAGAIGILVVVLVWLRRN